MAGLWALCVVLGIALSFVENCHGAQYFGKLIGKLSELHHGVSGEVYAVDARTLYIKDFTYDGQGPAAYFYASVHKAADKNGFRLRDETGSGEVIRRYRKEGVTLTLPEGKTIHSIKIFYLWCEEFDVNFGDVKIQRSFEYPRPQRIDSLKGVHSVSSDPIVIVDAQTLLIPNLSYDGEAPDAKFWVGRGAKPSPQGIRVPDENGKEVPLRRYDRKTVVLTLPGDLTVFDIGHFGIWCEMFTVDFGHVAIPQVLNIPPSLKMLGVSPQSKLNCEVLYDDLAFEVRWAVAGESIVLQLVAKLENREYMSFGLSGNDGKTVMIGGDVVVAWVDKQTLKGYAEDYYLEDKSQCSGPTGSCPDNRLSENTNNVRLLNAAMVNGYSIVTYQRPLKASDHLDRPILTNHSQAIIWALGPLNQRNEVSFHTKYLKKTHLIDFGRPARWNCPMPETEQPTMTAVYAATKLKTTSSTPSSEEDYYEEPSTSAPKRINGRRRGPSRGNSRPSSQESVEDSVPNPSRNKEQAQPSRRRGPQPSKESETNQKRNQTTGRKSDAWVIPPIECDEPEDGVFYAQMGPTGGKRGYPAITGHVGWGISWYINGLLIPEIHVVRGKSYNFVVEGGDDPEIPARYHPFYISDDPVGGYAYKTPEERKKVNVYAGTRTDKDGNEIPTGTGRLCTWTQTGDLEADDYASFGAYQRVLELKCDPSENPGVVQWTPDRNTPDTVYYQCFTHRYLGWKIHVHDSCDRLPAASELKASFVPAPKDILDKSDVDLDDSPSMRVETRVKQNNIFKEDNEAKDTKSTISEKVEDQPVEQLPNLNLSQPTNNFQPLHHVRTGSALYSYNPKQTQPKLHYFKPSTLLNVGLDSTNKAQSNLEYSSITSTTSSTTTTTSTTERSTTIPRFIDNIAVASDNVNQTYLVPPPVQNVIYRRPVNYIQVPIKVMPHNPLGLRYYGLPVMPYKKPIIRIPNYRPYKHKIYAHGSPYLILQPAPVITKSPIENQLKAYAEKPRIEPIKNIEISPQQASTEREPEIQTAPSTSIADITPNFLLRPAFNTGFKPGSIKIESGFKPIITKDFQDRVDKDEPLVEYESEKGIIQVNDTEKFETKPTQVFEPMFIPSPTFKPTKEKKVKINKRPVTKKGYEYMKIVIKRPRSAFEDSDDPEEPIAEAAERFDSYYLPPTNAKPVEVVREPSNIDIDLPEVNPMLGSPPDVVITYDGKKLSGQSLTANLNDRPSVITQRLSKASAYITARPQFGRFRGELPPLNIDYVNKNAPQLSSAGVLNRELDTPSLPSENEQKVASTRLSRVNESRK